MTVKQVFAAIVLALCLVLLLRLVLGERRRAAFDARARRAGLWLQMRAHGLRHAFKGLRGRGAAAREAEELIERARRGEPEVDRDGNVLRPRHFGGRRNDVH